MAVVQESPESDRLARLEATVDYLVREVGDIKAMVGSEMRSVRTELHEAIDGVRNEVGSVRNEIGGVRSEVGSVRNEMGSVRNEMGDIRVALREEMLARDARSHGKASSGSATRSSLDNRFIHRCHDSHLGVYCDCLDCGTFLTDGSLP